MTEQEKVVFEWSAKNFALEDKVFELTASLQMKTEELEKSTYKAKAGQEAALQAQKEHYTIKIKEVYY